MRSPSRSRPAQLLVTVAVMLMLAATRGSAQDAGSSGLLTVEFRGGSAAEYLTMLKRVAGDDFNVIYAREAAEVIVPELQLTRVSPGSAVSVLDGMSLELPGRHIRLTVNSLPQRQPGERPTFQVYAQVRGSQREESAHVWTVAALIDSGYSSNAILSAIEVSLATLVSKTELDVRFHEDTGLLIATGDEGQLGTIDQVIQRLRDSIDERREAKASDREAEVMLEVNNLRNEIAHLHMLNERLQHTLNERERELAIATEQLQRLLGGSNPRGDSDRPRH